MAPSTRSFYQRMVLGVKISAWALSIGSITIVSIAGIILTSFASIESDFNSFKEVAKRQVIVLKFVEDQKIKNADTDKNYSLLKQSQEKIEKTVDRIEDKLDKYIFKGN